MLQTTQTRHMKLKGHRNEKVFTENPSKKSTRPFAVPQAIAADKASDKRPMQKPEQFRLFTNFLTNNGLPNGATSRDNHHDCRENWTLVSKLAPTWRFVRCHSSCRWSRRMQRKAIEGNQKFSIFLIIISLKL